MFARLNLYAKALGAQGVIGSLVGKACGRPVVRAFRRAGIAHPMLIRLPSTDVDAYEQVFIERQYDFDVLEQPSVIIDAGANIGLASIYFANRFPNARVFAIECEPANYKVLHRNAEPYPNIVPIHAALWNENGTVNVVDPGLGQWGFMTTAAPAVNGVPVRARTLESIRREYGFAHIDILKIDIEGAEREVFDASDDWIDEVDTVIAELHDRLKPGCVSSFERATAAFSERWRRGENVYSSRKGKVAERKDAAGGAVLTG